MNSKKIRKKEKKTKKNDARHVSDVCLISLVTPLSRENRGEESDFCSQGSREEKSASTTL